MKDYRGVDDYAAYFRILANRAGIDKGEDKDVMMGHHFVQGLSRELKEWLIDHGVPKEFDLLVKNVQERYARGELMKSLLPPVPHNAPHAATSYQARNPNAMEIDAVNLSRDERECRRRLGLCFECGKKGHLVGQCRQRQNNQGRTSNNP